MKKISILSMALCIPLLALSTVSAGGDKGCAASLLSYFENDRYEAYRPFSRDGLNLAQTRLFLTLVSKNNVEGIRLWLEKGLNANAVLEQIAIVPQCWEGLILTPLIKVAQKDQRGDIVKLLVQYGADMRTPLKVWGGGEEPDQPIGGEDAEEDDWDDL